MRKQHPYASPRAVLDALRNADPDRDNNWNGRQNVEYYVKKIRTAEEERRKEQVAAARITVTTPTAPGGGAVTPAAVTPTVALLIDVTLDVTLEDSRKRPAATSPSDGNITEGLETLKTAKNEDVVALVGAINLLQTKKQAKEKAKGGRPASNEKKKGASREIKKAKSALIDSTIRNWVDAKKRNAANEARRQHARKTALLIDMDVEEVRAVSGGVLFPLILSPCSLFPFFCQPLFFLSPLLLTLFFRVAILPFSHFLPFLPFSSSCP